MSKYEISIEVAGPLAMWARPDTGSSPSSYPIPTWSAAKGLFEAIAFFNDGKAWINPVRVEICKPLGATSNGEVHYQRYMTNYCGPLRNDKLIKEGENYQHAALVVANPCYRIYAQIEKKSGIMLKRGDNPCHALQAMFKRRLAKGQCYHTPCMGWSEFVPRYWGPLRTTTEVDTAISLGLVSILRGVFDLPSNGKYAPRFQHGEQARISKGVLHYA